MNRNAQAATQPIQTPEQKQTDSKIIVLGLSQAASQLHSAGLFTTAHLLLDASARIVDLEMAAEAAKANHPATGVFKLSDRANRTIHHCLGLYDPNEADCGHFEGEVPPTEEDVAALMLLVRTSPLTAKPNLPALVQEALQQAKQEAAERDGKDRQPVVAGKYNGIQRKQPGEGYTKEGATTTGYDEKVAEGKALLDHLMANAPPGLDPETAKQSIRDFGTFLTEILSEGRPAN